MRANKLDITVVPVVVAAQRGRVHFLDSGPFGAITDDEGAIEVDALPVRDILDRVGTERADS